MSDSGDLLRETLDELSRAGHYDSTGGLLIASQKIAPRYRTFIDQEPAYPVLNLLSLGWSWGVRNFSVSLDGDTVRVQFKVDHMSPELLATTEELAQGQISRACSELARCLWSTLSLPLDSFRLRLIGHLRGLELTYARGQLRSQALPALNQAGLDFELRSPWMRKLAYNWRGPGGWLDNLAQRSAFFPGEILVNGMFVALPGDAAVIPPPALRWQLEKVVNRLVDSADHFATMPCYVYGPRNLAWTGGHRVPGCLEGSRTGLYYLDSPRLVNKSPQSGSAQGAAAVIANYTEPVRICLSHERQRVQWLDNCNELVGRTRRFCLDRTAGEREFFTAVPLRSDLIAWQQVNPRDPAVVHFVSQGLLLNPIAMPQLPRGLVVAALAPPQLHRDLSGWNAIQGDDLDKILAEVANGVTTLLANGAIGHMTYGAPKPNKEAR